MAIRPWSWNTSNGSATAAQTQRAYNALISGGNTSQFSRYVWNDIVDKVNEVARGLNLSWMNDYGSRLQTYVSLLFGNLTAEKFNAVRHNTRYRSWSWEIDPTCQGYTGRTDFRGVSRYTDKGADIVYGRYFLELTDRLNVVIGIINGTYPSQEMDMQLILSLLPEIELAVPESHPLITSTPHIMSSSAFMQADELPTWSLHILVPTPRWSAKMEVEDIASMMEGRVFLSSRIGGNVVRLPSAPLSKVIPVGVSLESFLHSFLSEPASADINIGFAIASTAHTGKTGVLQNQLELQHFMPATAVSDKAVNPGWNHIRIELNIGRTLVAERKKELDATPQLILSPNAKFSTRQPRPFDAAFVGGISSAPNFELADPFGIRIDSNINSPAFVANLGTLQYVEGMIADLILPLPLSHSATLAIDHVSTMFRAYMGMLQRGNGLLSSLFAPKLAKELVIKATIPADLFAAYAPVMEETLRIELAIGSHAHAGKAGVLSRYTGISHDMRGNANTVRSKPVGKASVHHSLTITESITRFKPKWLLGRSSMRSTVSATSFSSPSDAIGQSGIVIFPPTVDANMDAIHGMEDAIVNAKHTVDLTGNIAFTESLLSALAEQGHHVNTSADLGSIYCVDLSAMVAMGISILGFIDAEGGGWIYPTYDNGNLTVFQVYHTEQYGEHLFLDPLARVANTVLTQTYTAEMGWIYHASMERENTHGVNIVSNLQFIDRNAWLDPVLNEHDLYVQQALLTNQKNIVLEVI